MAGYVAILLNDPPTVEWVKRSAWGNGGDKWGSLQREQNELNKILLGVRIDFHAGIKMEWSTDSVGIGAPVMMQAPSDTYEAWIRLVIPRQLRGKVKYALDFSLYGTPEQRKTWTLNDRDAIIAGPGLMIQPVEENEDAVTRRMQVNRTVTTRAVGRVKIWDAPLDGELIVDERLMDN